MRRDPHETMMYRAIESAKRGRGNVEPNPMVGAVLVREGDILVEGFHRSFGGPHAEIDVLRAVPEATARGAHIYVTLEPCSTHGKTPPCHEALIRAGIRRVYYGTVDPNPAHAGRGLDELKRAGIEVIGPILEAECRALLADFTRYLTGSRPYVVAKWAQTLDGRTATRTGASQWISGDESRRRAHEERARADGILVGIGTVLADDPSLTTRLVNGKSPRRFCLDTELRIPASAKILGDGLAETTIFAAEDVCLARQAGWKSSARLCPLPRSQDGGLDLSAMLEALRKMGVNRLMVEGGPHVLGRMIAEHHVDRLLVLVAPKLIGDAAAVPALAGPQLLHLADATPIHEFTSNLMGSDLMISGSLAKGKY